MRAVAEHAAIGRRARPAGHWRRRFALGGAGCRRRHHPAARARPLSRIFFERHGDLERARPGARRLLLRISDLALDLLDQPAVRVARAALVLPQPPPASQAAAKADNRLARSGADPRIDNTDPDCARASRSGSRLGEERGSRTSRDRRRFFGGVDLSRERRTRADHSAPAVRQPNLHSGQPDQPFDVYGDACDDHPGTARFRARYRDGAERGRGASDPDDRRHGFRLIRCRTFGSAAPGITASFRSSGPVR
jgi:hypothetical protein